MALLSRREWADRARLRALVDDAAHRAAVLVEMVIVRVLVALSLGHEQVARIGVVDVGQELDVGGMLLVDPEELRHRSHGQWRGLQDVLVVGRAGVSELRQDALIARVGLRVREEEVDRSVRQLVRSRQSLVVVVALMVLTWGARPPARGVGVVLGWLLANAVLIGLYAVPKLPLWELLVIFVASTVWVVWLAWLGAWPQQLLTVEYPAWKKKLE